MLAKKYKLPIQSLINKKGKLVKTPYFLVKIYVAELLHSRFGVTISVKVAKKATERNRLKRLAYNFLKDYYKEIPSGDYWISILPLAANLQRDDFLKELKNVLHG